MNATLKKWLTICTLLALTTSHAAHAQLSGTSQEAESKQQKVVKDENGIRIVSNAKVSSILTVANEKIRVSGRMSFHLAASETLLGKGLVQVEGFSLAYFNAPQQMLAGKLEVKNEEGVLGFAGKTEKPQQLKYDAKSGRITGKITGYVDAAYMSKLVLKPMVERKKDALTNEGRYDLFETVTQPATLEIDIQLAEPLKPGGNEISYLKGDIDLRLHAKSTEYERYQLSPFSIDVSRKAPVDLEIAPWWYFEAAKSLCIQPVRIGRLKVINSFPPLIHFNTTGDGLAFGQPGANTEWQKADVLFNYRNWKTLWKSGYWTVDTNGQLTSTEQANLMDELDDADCIEVFFIDEFVPVSWGGGGATWGRGVAGSQIITSDANAVGGIDFTHLAHEYGHVINLCHPNQANCSPDGTTNTLMCGSGYLNDNPTRNSQENKNNLANPLLVFSFKWKTAGPDCQNNADCGSCP